MISTGFASGRNRRRSFRFHFWRTISFLEKPDQIDKLLWVGLSQATLRSRIDVKRKMLQLFVYQCPVLLATSKTVVVSHVEKSLVKVEEVLRAFRESWLDLLHQLGDQDPIKYFSSHHLAKGHCLCF